MTTVCITYNGITTIETFIHWTDAVRTVEECLRSFYPCIKDWEVELAMIQLEERPFVIYKNFFADLS